MGVLEWIPHKQASQRDSRESPLLAVLPRKVCVGGGGWVGKWDWKGSEWVRQGHGLIKRVVSTYAAEPNPN